MEKKASFIRLLYWWSFRFLSHSLYCPWCLMNLFKSLEDVTTLFTESILLKWFILMASFHLHWFSPLSLPFIACSCFMSLLFFVRLCRSLHFSFSTPFLRPFLFSLFWKSNHNEGRQRKKKFELRTLATSHISREQEGEMCSCLSLFILLWCWNLFSLPPCKWMTGRKEIKWYFFIRNYTIMRSCIIHWIHLERQILRT